MLIRTLRTAEATLTKTFTVDEVPTAATGSVTVTVTDANGDAFDTDTASGPDADDTYSYTFPGADEVSLYNVAWTATVAGDAMTLDQDWVEVVGGYFFTVAEGRAVSSRLANTTSYPYAKLVQARIDTEVECENICEQAFVPRYAREVLSGTGRYDLRLSWPLIRSVRSINIQPYAGADYAALTAEQLAAVSPGDDGVLRLDFGQSWPTSGWSQWGQLWPPGRRNIVVEYEHGADFPSPDIVRGAKLRFKSLLLEPDSRSSDRAERVATTETGVVTLASPGPMRTGIPEVDAAYGRNPSPIPGFG